MRIRLGQDAQRVGYLKGSDKTQKAQKETVVLL